MSSLSAASASSLRSQPGSAALTRSSASLRSNLKAMTSLEEFRVPSDEAAPVYHDAIELPAFLAQNLRASDRRVKHLTGDHALLTAFYFSLMRLAFDLEDGREYALRARRVLTGEEEFGEGELEDQTLSDGQYRGFLREFMELLETEGRFEDAVQPFPIIDAILRKLFQRLVPVTLLLRDEPDLRVAERVLNFLTRKFGMGLQVISGCFKLVEPDTFLYVENLQSVYLVYVEALSGIQEEEEDSDHSQSIARGTPNAPTERSRPGTSCKAAGSRHDVSVLTLKQGSAEQGEKPKNFQTVINILQSNNSMRSSGHRTNAMEGSVTRRIDTVKENNTEPQAGCRPTPSSNQQLLEPPAASLTPSLSHCSKLSIPSSAREHSQHSILSSPSQHAEPTHNHNPSKFSSQIYTRGKPSKLELFSSVSGAREGRWQAEARWQAESACDDSGYVKFTGNTVLSVLDEQFREQIKTIKQQYRKERSSVRPL